MTGGNFKLTKPEILRDLIRYTNAYVAIVITRFMAATMPKLQEVADFTEKRA